MGLRLLVVDGNEADARAAHLAAFGKTMSQSYAEAIGAVAADAICDVCMPSDAGANLPDRGGLESYDGVAVTGSHLNLYDGGPAISRQLDFARAVYASKTPFFGSCWGLQLAAAAAGGEVRRSALGRECGVARNIAPTAAGRGHPLLAGRPPAFDAPCIHLDVVAIAPAACVALAGNAHSPIQAAEIHHDGGVFWGVQYHPEFSLRELATILRRRIGLLTREGFFADAVAGETFCDDWERLDANPARADLAWRYGVQPEILDQRLRLTEIRNWIDLRVRTEKSRRGRA